MDKLLTNEDMYYFQHSKDASTSYEMILLTSRFKKSEVYGAYWLLEELAMKANNRLTINYLVFAKYLELTETDAEEMINYMIEIGLFVEEDNVLKSVKLEAFIDDVNEKKGFTAEKQNGRGGSRSNAGRKSKINQTEIKEIKQESNVNQNEIKENQNEIKEDSCNSLDNADLQEDIEIKEEIKINQTEIKTEIKEIKQESNVNQSEIKEIKSEIKENQNACLKTFENSLNSFDFENEGGYRGENNKHNNNYNNNNNNNSSRIKNALCKVGVSMATIERIILQNPNPQYVDDVIKHFQDLHSQGKINNLPAVVVKAIHDNWQLPAKPEIPKQEMAFVRRNNKLWNDVQSSFVRIFKTPLHDMHYDMFSRSFFDSCNLKNMNIDFFAGYFQKRFESGFKPQDISPPLLISELSKGFDLYLREGA